MKSAQEILQRLLDERYEAGQESGYEDGYKLGLKVGYGEGQAAGFDEGIKVGYEKAMFEVQDFVDTRLAPPTKLALTDHPGDENEAVSEPEPSIAVKLDVKPHLQRAYERLKQCPGITSREARANWGGSNTVLYTLVKLGLAEKRGPQFYANEDATA